MATPIANDNPTVTVLLITFLLARSIWQSFRRSARFRRVADYKTNCTHKSTVRNGAAPSFACINDSRPAKRAPFDNL
jgi:hypothetical protein